MCAEKAKVKINASQPGLSDLHVNPAHINGTVACTCTWPTVDEQRIMLKMQKKKKDDKLGHCLLDIIKYCRPFWAKLKLASSHATHRSTQHKSSFQLGASDEVVASVFQPLSVCMHFIWLLSICNCGHLSTPHYSVLAISNTNFSQQAQSRLQFAPFNSHYLLQGGIQSPAAQSKSPPEHLNEVWLRCVLCVFMCVSSSWLSTVSLWWW